MDASNYNLGPQNSHPVEQFWADRFLTHSSDPKLSFKSTDTQNTSTDNEEATNSPKFSLNGYAGAWIPFGGGIHQCPGRHWVKLQMLLSFAMMCTAFEIEILDGGKDPGVDMGKYGLEALQPKGKTPFRIMRKV